MRGLVSGARVARLVGAPPGAVSTFRELHARACDAARGRLRGGREPDGGGRMTFGAAGDAQTAPSRFVAVFEHPQVRGEVERLACVKWGWGTPREMHVRALKWHRERCTFELTMKTTNGRYGAIAKAFDDDRSHVLPAMEAICHAGFGAAAAFSIPRPLAYIPAWRVLLEEKASGPSAKVQIVHGRASERRMAAERCGQWLARLPAPAPRVGNAAAPPPDASRPIH